MRIELLPYHAWPVWTPAVINHLWQSTAVLVVAWFLTLLLRSNSARVRYAIWMIASIKFLVPFTFLSSIGAQWVAAHPPVRVSASRYVFVEEITESFRQAALPAPALPAVASTGHSLQIVPILITSLWLCGVLAMLIRWMVLWRRAAVLASSAENVAAGREFDCLRLAELGLGITRPTSLALSAGETEPGVFGIIRPVILWPRSLSLRLNDAQIEAIMSHEVEHIRRHDNLHAAIHSVTQAIFWFHPLVRWMSHRLNEERERACDETVLGRNAHPETYAESILKVCEFCLEPRTPCISGVSGADLKARILHIMSRQSGVALSIWRKAVLASAAILTLATPVGFGVVHGQASTATTIASGQTPAVVSDLPKYDVASIKPNKMGDNRVRFMMTPDGISLMGAPMRMLLPQSFGVEEDRIVGEPDWVKSRRYDIEAKVEPENAPKLKDLKADQRNAMMLQLLVDRFNLKYHHEQREMTMYTMVVAKSGLKMKPTKPDQDGPEPDTPPSGDGPRPKMGRHMVMMNPGHVESTGTSTEQLAHLLSRQLSRTVVDRTGLTGEYDFTLDYTPDNIPTPAHGEADSGSKSEMPADQGGPSIFTAVEEQLGLKLEATKGMVDVIVIDHIDPPTEN